MSDKITATLPLKRWQGDRGTYHLVIFEGEEAEALAMHARLHRLEFGKSRGFGSVKVAARIGETKWRTSVFPQEKQSEWVLLVSRKVMRAEALSEGDEVALEVTPI
ncbi:DUF1905 domain-containing protein [Erythrobacter sp. THAF29]|uniref:DUF1905 domain-containing protein n=1 Tax=Erythrobacter sp. THAF29 TaxID=2587851 RepID=UPI0012687ABD|nr:DUF1905 domain-containing protein [Erythrobacter sp. THAF29]QFT78737.1 hypothetical protein FIU90_14400 [Erythrobacter sp. THAF29]